MHSGVGGNVDPPSLGVVPDEVMAFAKKLQLTTNLGARVRTYQLHSYHCRFRIAGNGSGVGDPSAVNRASRIKSGLAILHSQSSILKLFIPQTESWARKLQHRFGGCQKDAMATAPGKKLHRVIHLAPISFKAEGQVAISRLPLQSRSAALNLRF